jgi:hypothetical protein
MDGMRRSGLHEVEHPGARPDRVLQVPSVRGHAQPLAGIGDDRTLPAHPGRKVGSDQVIAVLHEAGRSRGPDRAPEHLAQQDGVADAPHRLAAAMAPRRASTS